jgi:putative mRNA 3-end processing factor
VDLLTVTPSGIYCPAGDFYIDPWRSVDRALVTHAHSDHARWGMGRYLCAAPGLEVLRLRMEDGAKIEAAEFGKVLTLNGVKVSFHPSGHILGAAQIRVEDKGEVWVVTGDYKTQHDPTCAPFELVRCHTLITECTFGLPNYRWPKEDVVFGDINAWWRANQERGVASVIYCYTLGKAQRILGGIDASIGPIFVHGAIERMNRGYRWAGVRLPDAKIATTQPRGFDWTKALILAPSSADGTPWLRRFGHISTGYASGWMQVRGIRRRRAVDRGFVLSDHVDWPSLLGVIEASGAERVIATHGFTSVLARYLSEMGTNAEEMPTQFVGESLEADRVEPASEDEAV